MPIEKPTPEHILRLRRERDEHNALLERGDPKELMKFLATRVIRRAVWAGHGAWRRERRRRQKGVVPEYN